MSKPLAAAAAAALLLGGAAVGVFATGNVFSDIAGHEHEAEIRLAASKGLFAGYGDGTFRPDRTLTNKQSEVVLRRLLDNYTDDDGNSILTRAEAAVVLTSGVCGLDGDCGPGARVDESAMTSEPPPATTIAERCLAPGLFPWLSYLGGLSPLLGSWVSKLVVLGEPPGRFYERRDLWADETADGAVLCVLTDTYVRHLNQAERSSSEITVYTKCRIPTPETVLGTPGYVVKSLPDEQTRHTGPDSYEDIRTVDQGGTIPADRGPAPPDPERCPDEGEQEGGWRPLPAAERN